MNRLDMISTFQAYDLVKVKWKIEYVNKCELLMISGMKKKNCVYKRG